MTRHTPVFQTRRQSGRRDEVGTVCQKLSSSRGLRCMAPLVFAACCFSRRTWGPAGSRGREGAPATSPTLSLGTAHTHAHAHTHTPTPGCTPRLAGPQGTGMVSTPSPMLPQPSREGAPPEEAVEASG